jgi:hypothetical protein
MNCELAHERIVLAAYSELADELVHELERHLDGCRACAQERDQLLALKLLADANPLPEVPANLVARSRMRLDEALDTLPPKRWLERLAQRTRNSFASLVAAPLAAVLLLLVGVGAGMLGGYRYAQDRPALPVATGQLAETTAQLPSSAEEVANVSSIIRQPNSEIVEVSYNQVIPQRIQGSLDDPRIRQLLMLASQNSASQGVRDDSVGLLAAECRAGHSCQPAGIRDALMVALRYDKSPAVRQKALEGLEPYVAQDVRVRDAVLEALLNDPDAHVRTNAITILEPVEADSSVRQVLNTLANSDENSQIRTVSRQVLSREPQIQ